jgi:ribose 5-phosphate isomerase RpiB
MFARRRRRAENVVEVTGLGMAAVKGEGQSISYDGFGQGPKTPFTTSPTARVHLTREAKEDNLYQEIAEANAQALPFSMLVTKETVHANVLNRAFNSSYTGGDGKELLSPTPTRPSTERSRTS